MNLKFWNWIVLIHSALVTILLFSKIPCGSASNILFFHVMATVSHRNAIWPLAETLADKGHNVTYIFPMTKRNEHHPKIEELIPSKMVPILMDYVGDFDINIRLNNTEMEWMEEMPGTSFKLCEAFYKSPEIIEWLKRPGLHFDLIMVDGCFGECGYGLVHKFRAKLVIFTALLPPFIYDGLGIVPESSSIPDILFNAKPSSMTFFDRVMSTLTPLLWRYKFMEYIRQLEPVVREGLNATDLPPLTELEASASLVFVSSHAIEDYPRSLPPMIVSYSGLSCSKEILRKQKPLPANIETFLENGDGLIYVSFGSATDASAMPVEMRNHFFNAFRNFPKLRFLWRWTGPEPVDKPKNVMLLPWFPQRDILSHPKIKGFVMQAGRPSTQEALCYGVPLISVPIFADQDYNANRLEHVGAAILLHLNSITEETLTHSFMELLENPKYKTRMMELSEQFRDRPLDPLENAVYWTEYVLRRDTSIFRPLGISQTWWERRLLDVYGFFLIISLTLVGIILFMLWWCYCKLRSVSLRGKERNKKTN